MPKSLAPRVPQVPNNTRNNSPAPTEDANAADAIRAAADAKDASNSLITVRTFDDAQKEVFRIMSEDSFLRFLRSTQCARFVKAWVKRQGNRGHK